MVAAGFLMLVLFALASWASIKRNAERKPWLLRFALFSLPLPWIAAQTGWYVAEHGRQPWSIAEVLPTHLSTSTLAAGDIWGSLIALVAFYSLLLVVEMFLMIRFARLGRAACTPVVITSSCRPPAERRSCAMRSPCLPPGVFPSNRPPCEGRKCSTTRFSSWSGGC